MSGHERLDHRQHRPLSAMLPSKAWTFSGNPAWSASRPTVASDSRRRSLENPPSRNPVLGVGLEVRVDTSRAPGCRSQARVSAHAADSFRRDDAFA